jgi:fumarate reductase subunit C
MPNPYRRTPSNTWYLDRWPYRIFILREWSATFMAIYVLILLRLMQKVLTSEAAYLDYVDFLKSPVMIAFHVVALLFTLLHAVTWFQAVPKAMPVRMGEDKVPAVLMIAPAYVTMLGVSVVVAAIFLMD